MFSWAISKDGVVTFKGNVRGQITRRGHEWLARAPGKTCICLTQEAALAFVVRNVPLCL